jgi:Cys-tRNA(Pro)/Cys-tRNA(Cys) deacylase
VRLGNGELAVAIIPVSALLSLKQMARATGAKKVEMAPPAAVERSTGYLLGGVSPLAQKKPLQTVIDNAARDHLSIFVSAGRRGLEVELKPEDLKLLTAAS